MSGIESFIPVLGLTLLLFWATVRVVYNILERIWP